ncbi:DUF4142 domain-containing protein [Stenotrophobium rhamnosiphilum]|nr:DUF4142 domain-containing protein [Stenotrophobium rhamnosiphilum]
MKPFKRNLALIGLAVGIGMPLYASADSSSDSTKATGPTTVSKDDIEFLGKAAQADMTEVQAATIASSRALTTEAKSLATSAKTDHEVNNTDLRAIAATKGVVLPTRLDSKHQKELDNLQKVDAKKFDAAYAEVVKDSHEDAVDLFEKTAKKSKDADIQTYAKNTLPTLKQHLDMAKRLDEKS